MPRLIVLLLRAALYAVFEYRCGIDTCRAEIDENAISRRDITEKVLRSIGYSYGFVATMAWHWRAIEDCDTKLAAQGFFPDKPVLRLT